MINKPSEFRKTLVARALVMAFGAGALAMAYSPAAVAQSSASGIVFGTLAPGAGNSVTLRNLDTNATRTVAIDASGTFQATAVAAGRYSATLNKDGKVVGTAELEVVAGQGTQATFAVAGIQSVDVRARRSRIDVSNSNNGAIFTSRELAKLPMAANLTAVVMLAPNTVRADAAFGGASFGGSGASENAYYINGFPVTNPLSNLGSSELPFGAIAQASVITGGFGAEFGRSIGGVLNVTTKSGANNWEFGATASIAPESMVSKSKNIYYPNTGSYPATDGKLHFRRDTSTTDQKLVGAYVGGPIIADKLFMFVAADQTVTNAGFANSQTNTTLARDGWNDQRATGKRYLAKFDLNLSDDHRLEWTSIGDQTDLRARTYGYDPVTGAHNNIKYNESTSRNTGAGAPANPDANAKNINGAGSEIHSLKYIGQITQELTVTALYGQNTGKRSTVYEGYDINGILRSVNSNPEGREPSLDAQGLYKNYQKYGGAGGVLGLPGKDTVKSARLDLEYRLGRHTLRAGLDDNRIESKNVGFFSAGGGSWSYNRLADGAQFEETNLSVGRPAILANFGGLGTKGYYAQLFTFSSITDSGAHQKAAYIEDRFQITRNLLLTGGLRNEEYANSFGNGTKFVEIRNQLAPRLSGAWDVNGDATLKIFGSAGRYHLQLPSQVAARAAGVSSYLLQDFTYTGIDKQGQPTGLVAVNTPASPDGEWGQIKDPRATVTKNLKPNFQDELTLGFEMVATPTYNVGAKFTYRKLGGGIDDSCDTRPISNYASAHGYTPDSLQTLCYIFNPGEDVTLWSKGTDGSGRYVSFTARELGFPKAERKYAALDMYAEHPLRNGWYGRLNYTLSRSKGNMEGQTRSDTQQADVGISASFDFPEFMSNANGVLPNDRTHVVKAFGFLELNAEWSLGANLLLSSGRPKLCLGTNVEIDQNIGYGPEYYYCDNKVSPRGSQGRMPMQKNLDLNITYSPQMVKGLALKMDVFNVADTQTVLTRREQREGGDGHILSNYGEVRNTAPARSVKLTMEYKHKF